MKNKEYWKKRFEEMEAAQNAIGKGCNDEIENQYRRAQREIEAKINTWYGRFAKNNNISMQEARRLLNSQELEELKWDINEYIKYGKQNAMNQQWMKQLENASARYHISRLESIKLQLQQSMEVMFGNQLDAIDDTMRKAYKSGYYRTAYEIQKGMGVGWTFASIDNRSLKQVINNPWAADGKNFSERVWGNRDKLIRELNTELTRNIITGSSPQKAIKRIMQKMNASRSNAERLVLTETAFFSSAAQNDCFKELEVEQYEIVATLDSRTSDICREMDGKHFKMSEWKIGLTAPPFHVRCRSTTCPYFDDEFDSVGKRAARNAEGKVYYVPADTTYNEWKKKFVDTSPKSGKINLSSEEQEALNNYMSFYSYVINERLRNIKSIDELSEKERIFVNNLDSALKKFPVYEGNLLRTVDFSDYVDEEDRIKAFVSKYSKGDEIVCDSYTSTSKIEGYNKNAKIKIYIKDARKGRDVSSVNNNEQEVLYERGSAFKVNKVEKENETYYILLEEV